MKSSIVDDDCLTSIDMHDGVARTAYGTWLPRDGDVAAAIDSGVEDGTVLGFADAVGTGRSVHLQIAVAHDLGELNGEHGRSGLIGLEGEASGGAFGDGLEVELQIEDVCALPRDDECVSGADGLHSCRLAIEDS